MDSNNVTRILLLGGAGQLGQALQALPWPGELLAPSRQQLPLEQSAALAEWLARWQPGLIINAAAFTQVDAAEQASALNWRLNAELPAQLAAYASAAQCQLVHYSTDYVFDGSGDAPWPEHAAPAPLNAYGRAKAAGDAAVLGCPQALLLRTSWVYAPAGRNFMQTILQLARQHSALNVVADQVGAPTPAWLLANLTQQLWRQDCRGLYHTSCAGATSWHQFACAIVNLATAAGLPLLLSAANIRPVTSADYPQLARRPLNSRLDLTKLSQALGQQPADWFSALQTTFAQYLAQHSAAAGQGVAQITTEH